MSTANTTYNSHFLITAPNIDIDLLWILTIVFVGLAIVYFLSIFFFRNKISSRSALTRKRKKELSPMISEFLFYEEDDDKTEKSRYIDLKIQIRELLKDNFNRKLLTEILLDLRKDVSGDTKVRLFKLYQDLGLEKDAFEKLNSWRWEVVSKGISHLTQMHVASAYGFITKFINHRRATIRKQAEIAIVTLKPEGINYFLDTTCYKISEWQQVKLLEVIRNQEDLDPPRYKMWLTSTNKHVVLFALRLIKYYNQNDANTSLIELVKHKNNQIKVEALSCIKEFNVVEALPTLKQVFSKCNADTKIAILGAVGNLGSSTDVHFLQEIAQREGNFSVKSKALAAVNMILPGTIMPTKGIENIGTYVQSDNYFENLTEAISSDVPDTLIEETLLDTQDLEHGKTAEKLADTETIDQEEASLELNKELGGERDNTEIDMANTADVINEKVTDTPTSMVPIEIENVESQSIDEKIVVNETDFQQEEVIEESQQVVNKTKEVLDQDSDTTTERIVLESHENIMATEEVLSDSQNVNSFAVDFIPIVTTNKVNPDQFLEKYSPMSNAENQELDLKNIEVDFEEIVAHKTNRAKDSETGYFDISEINFLPIIVDTNGADKKADSFEGREHTEASPEEMEVFYEEVQGLPMDSELNSLITEINELNFLPIVVDEALEGKETISSKASDALNDIEGYTLSDFEVDFDETPKPNEVETVRFDLEDSPIIDVETPDVDDIMSWLMTQNELTEIEIEYEIVSVDEERVKLEALLPEPIYYDEHEAYMMGLLDDLEELGDSREIPFLEELLAVEEKSFIKDRITNLIDRFSTQKDGRKTTKKYNEEKVDLPVFSVFADLFKSIDTESKLILLGEIVAVGDEKEISFLDGLLEDPHAGIRKKAQEALKQLVAKISETDNTDKPKPVVEELPTRLFDVHMPKNQSQKEFKGVDDDAHFSSSTEIPTPVNTEIFNIDFELAEVLDKEYCNKILNLPVIATEISPNGASLIFQINNIIKKFNG